MGHWNGEALREARSSRRLTQEELAEAIGVERKAVMAWEAGREPQLRHAVALADLFGVSLDDLIHEPDHANGAPVHGKSHEPDTAAVEGSAGLAHHGG